MKEKETKNKFTISKIAIGIIAIVALIAIGLTILFLNKNNKTDNIKETGLSEKKYAIKESETKQIKLVDYDDTNFTMKIPDGWKVETGGEDMYFSIRVYDPNDERYQIFAILKAEPLLKNEKAKNWYENYYNSFGGDGNKLLAKAIVLSQPTIETFYSRFNEYVKYTKEMGATFKAPDLKNFTVTESFENNSQLKSIAKDDKILRGTFQNSETGKKGEGLFMGTLVDPGKNMSLGYDTLFYTVYNVIGISTGENDLVNYEEILTNSLNSLVYKDSFVNSTISNINQTTQNTLKINKSINDAFSSYNDAWTARQKTYDITSQKYSDATLGYERVYDTDTGDIYKAYNGFSDEYDGKRYQPITDDMYTESFTGYIEKVK